MIAPTRPGARSPERPPVSTGPLEPFADVAAPESEFHLADYLRILAGR